MERHPYFLVQLHGQDVKTEGQDFATFGHRLPSAGCPVDDGVFAGWHWDGSRLIVNNDRYGFYPLFWFRTPDGGVCISSSLTSLVEHGAPTALDIEGLAIFFRLGIFVGDDTPFAAIKAVSPNAVFEWQDGVLTCSGRYPPVPATTTMSRGEAIDRYIELFARAMAKRIPVSSNFAVPISGGRDSRHILLELHRLGLQPAASVSAMDNPPDPNRDPEVAKLLCDALGFEHHVVDQKLSLLQAEERKNRETHFCARAHAWYLALADFLNARFDCVYDGIAGDVLSQSLFLDVQLDAAFRSHDPKTISAALLTQHGSSRSGLNSLLNGELRVALEPEVANDRLSREVIKHLDMPNPIASFFFWNRTRRMTALAPYGLLAGIPLVHAPFLDHDLFDFMTTLPASMEMGRKFHDDAIARAYPAYSNIPYADNKLDAPTDDTVVSSRFFSDAARKFMLRKPWSLMHNVGPRVRILAGTLIRGSISTWMLPILVYLDQIETLMQRHQSQD